MGVESTGSCPAIRRFLSNRHSLFRSEHHGEVFDFSPAIFLRFRWSLAQRAFVVMITWEEVREILRNKMKSYPKAGQI